MEDYFSLQLFSLLGLFGTALTIFYQKDFALREHVGSRLKKAVGLLVLWAFSLFCEDAFAVAPISTLVYVACEIHGFVVEEKFKSLVLSTTAFLCTTLTDDILVCLAVLCAMTQLLRWPIWLKNSLRELRIIFGPVYPILVIGASIQSGNTSNLLTLSACMSLVAAFFLRPDNNAIFSLVPKVVGFFVPSSKTRKLTHGLLMFLSLISAIVHGLRTLTVHRTVLVGTMFVGGLNVLLYVFAAELPRKLYRFYVQYARTFHIAGQQRIEQK